MKSIATKNLESTLYRSLRKLGTYICFEVAIPSKRLNKEIVDMLMYNTSRGWYCFELKTSVSDFHSKCKKSFYGNYNYYALTPEVYEKVKNEIPADIGVYVFGSCVKRAKHQALKVDNDKLLFALMQGLSREYNKRNPFIEEKTQEDVW